MMSILSEHKTSWWQGKQIGLLSAAVIVLLILGTFVSVQGTLSLMQASDWVVHTLETQKEVGRIQILLQNTEAAQRIYLIVGNERYLQQFEQGTQNLF